MDRGQSPNIENDELSVEVIKQKKWLCGHKRLKSGEESVGHPKLRPVSRLVIEVSKTMLQPRAVAEPDRTPVERVGELQTNAMVPRVGSARQIRLKHSEVGQPHCGCV